VQESKGMAIAAYILTFIPLLTRVHETPAFVKYHANQGTALLIAGVAWGMVYGILPAILTAIFLNSSTWGLWGLLNIILGLLGWVLLCVVGIINAMNGRIKPLSTIDGITVVKIGGYRDEKTNCTCACVGLGALDVFLRAERGRTG
jgi:hypothetical protein